MRRPRIPQRRVIYLGCEGASEAGYAALLQEFALAAGLAVHLKIDDLGVGAGDPFTRIERARQGIARERAKRVAPSACFVLLDDDQIAGFPQEVRRVRDHAAAHGITIIWQRPCFEAVLLRHMPDRAGHRPSDTPSAARALLREWPEYQKPMGRVALARRLDLDAILRAAAVEADLRILLRVIGLLA